MTPNDFLARWASAADPTGARAVNPRLAADLDAVVETARKEERERCIAAVRAVPVLAPSTATASGLRVVRAVELRQAAVDAIRALGEEADE